MIEYDDVTKSDRDMVKEIHKRIDADIATNNRQLSLTIIIMFIILSLLAIILNLMTFLPSNYTINQVAVAVLDIGLLSCLIGMYVVKDRINDLIKLKGE